MAYHYIGGDRDQLLLLPVDMNEWVADGHLSKFLIGVVERIDTRALHARHPNDGVGRPAYDPDMMLTLLLYAYSTSLRSSRRIEQACRTDAAFRLITGGVAPDHATIARFLVNHEQAIHEVFTQVLGLCVEAGLVDCSIVAVDGSKLGCDAALDRNMTARWVRAQVDAVLAEAVANDHAEDHTPPGLFDLAGVAQVAAAPQGRRAKALMAALAEADHQQDAAQQAARDCQAKAVASAEQGHKLNGRKPADPAAALVRAQADERATVIQATQRARQRLAADPDTPPRDLDQALVSAAVQTDAKVVAAVKATAAAATTASHAADTRKINITDPDSRIMKSAKGWVQGYNAQAMVDRNQIIIGHAVSQDPNDLGLYQPMVDTTLATLAAAGACKPVGVILADAGYWSKDNATAAGPDRLIATTKDHKQRRAARELGTTTGPPPNDATPLEAMEHRLRTADGAALYAHRSHLVEPVFAIKANHGYHRFRRRGHKAASSEWALLTTVHNLGKLRRG